MFKKIGYTISKGFRNVGKFFKSIGTVMTTPFKRLTFLQSVVKLLGIGLGIYLAIAVVAAVIAIIAIGYLIGSVIFSFGGAIENGTNEMLGRNRRRY